MKKIFFTLATVAYALMMQAETFNKVTDVASLQDGDKVVMACETKGVISGAFDLNSSNKPIQLKCVDVTFNNGSTTIENPTVIKLTKKSNGDWNLYLIVNDQEKPIGHAPSSDNSVDLKSGTTTDFAITFNNGNVIIKSRTQKDQEGKFPQFYSNTSSGKFRLYNSTTQNAIQLYKLDESTIPEVVPTAVELNKWEAEIRIGNTETLTATVTPDNAADKSITWGSTNTSVATVADGVITPVAVGTAEIWVKATAGENVTDTCVVTVLPALNTTKATYKIVQKADYLSEGAKIFFGTLKEGENFVMGRYVSGNNIKGTAATYKDEAHHSVEAELQYAYTVQHAGNYYVFVDQDGKYLRTLTSAKLGNGTELDDYAKWEIGEFEQDEATVELKNVGCNKYLYYNHSADLFNIYDYQGASISSNFTRIVLFSSEAPDWVEREKHPSIVVSG